MKHKVKDQTHLVRDTTTNCIINTSQSQYNDYIRRRNVKNEEKQTIENLETDVASMKDDLNEIKSLLRSLTNGS
jgi:hypothetical protein|tara:strand:+ start:239 stop:460 length:222 start_codon:yes stop_codon:yes gene_type:complete